VHKPAGYVSTARDPQGRPTVVSLVPSRERLYPVGRLDTDTTGLLLLTNDGDLTNQLTHPRFGVAKTYRAVVDGTVLPHTLQELEKGVWLADPKGGKGARSARSHVKIVKKGRDKSVLEITMREGRDAQLRRILARLGHKVRDLTRTRMGPLTLHGLGPGQVRSLTPREVRELRQLPRRGEARRPAGRAAEGGGAGDARDD
jgi:23S rRNA pseudouridine2605 synthase